MLSPAPPAAQIKEGVDSAEGVEGVLYQVPETLPAEARMRCGWPCGTEVPISGSRHARASRFPCR
jgi:hypothetical protein